MRITACHATNDVESDQGLTSFLQGEADGLHMVIGMEWIMMAAKSQRSGTCNDQLVKRVLNIPRVSEYTLQGHNNYMCGSWDNAKVNCTINVNILAHLCKTHDRPICTTLCLSTCLSVS